MGKACAFCLDAVGGLVRRRCARHLCHRISGYPRRSVAGTVCFTYSGDDMIKRMTLLARKEGTSVSDFRAYWSGCHAQLALCMDGIAKYTQNRVEKTLWKSGGGSGCFDVDGIVELYFESDELMSEAQRSAVGSRYIPEDEPNFLRGWTLCVVDHEDEAKEQTGVKVILVAALRQVSHESSSRR